LVDIELQERHKQRTERRRIKPHEKFPAGTAAMTTVSTCTVEGRYKDGDYYVTWPVSNEHQEMRTVKPRDLWLRDEYPSWDHDKYGGLTEVGHEVLKTDKTPDALDIDLDDRIGRPLDSIPIKPRHTETNENMRVTRSRSKLMAHRAAMRGPS
jgi:hypothetical protein